MTLNIIVSDSNPVRPIIKTLCERVGIVNYYIMDPKSDDVERAFRFVLFLGSKTPKTSAFKEWLIPLVPSKDMPVESKQKVLQAFQAIKEEMDKHNTQKDTVSNADIPPIKELGVYMNEYKGCFFQMRLSDRRSVGVYPDGEKLLGQCDLEYHVSELVSLIKIKDLFQPTSISIKEL